MQTKEGCLLFFPEVVGESASQMERGGRGPAQRGQRPWGEADDGPAPPLEPRSTWTCQPLLMGWGVQPRESALKLRGLRRSDQPAAVGTGRVCVGDSRPRSGVDLRPASPASPWLHRTPRSVVGKHTGF